METTIGLLLVAALLAPQRASAGNVNGAIDALAQPQTDSRSQPCAGSSVRNCRRISRQEIWAAVQSALQGGRVPAGVELRSAELGYNSPLTASADEVSLRVKDVSYDAILGQMHFVLDAPRDSRLLPFLVTAPLHEASPETTINPAVDPSVGKSSASGPGMSGRASLWHLSASSLGTKVNPADALVTAGKTARMQIFSSTMHMSLDVVPLESGGMHQRVRVRVAGGAKILQGEVVAPGQLESRF